jgi:tetratricopeptide (TPR) repeat protein
MLGDALREHQAGRLTEAERIYRQILAIDAGHADSLHLLGMIALRGGRHEAALETIRKAIAINPAEAAYYCSLGTVLQAQRKLDEAVICYEQALALNPDHTDTHNNLGIALVAQGRLAEAITHYERVLELNPDHVLAHNNLGIALVAQDKGADAAPHYERALQIDPNHADSHNNLGIVLMAQGKTADGMARFEHALVLNPDHADAHNNLGVALKDQGKIDDAMAHYRRVLALNPDHAEVLNNLANVFKERGSFDDALACCARAIAIKPDYAEAHFNRAQIKCFHHGDAELAALETLARSGGALPTKAASIHFALAKALDDCGDYDRAFEHLRKGNALKRGAVDYDEASVFKFFQRVSAVFDRRLLDRLQGEGDPSLLPIFVLGMPRSGSTLIEQILASHPQVHGAGELTALDGAIGSVLNAGNLAVQYPECVPALDGATLRRLGGDYLARLPATAPGETRITDKLPGNFLHIGMIRLILPHARIIHTMRDPMDTCVSCYSKLFISNLDFTYDLGELGRYYRAYREMMAHWRSVLPPDALLDVSYEEVVNDLEGQARRLIKYCGLPWDERCIHFHKTSRPVNTASSVQVRQPLFRDSLRRWRHYEAGIAPLLRELESLS